MDSSPGVPELPEAALQPATDDGVGIATVGTIAFAIALGLCLLSRDDLSARGDQWWTLTCVSGVVVGLVLRGFGRRRARAYREQAPPAAPVDDRGPGGG